ncbi:MAG TPA: TIGR03032 family protein [Thermoanaerobaculia bacterium]|jgi:uncharacterized protein (TIGR03032 family)
MTLPRIARPIFIVAPPSSGAELLFQLLSTTPALSPVQDVPELGTAELPDVLYRRLHHHDQRLLVLDERNARHLSQLAELFPDAQFICMHREAPAAIATVVARDGGNSAERATREWIDSASSLLDGVAQLPREQWIGICYESLLENAQREIARLCDFLGIGVPQSTVLARDEPTIPEALLPFLARTTAVAERAAVAFANTPRGPHVPAASITFDEAFRSTSTASFPEILHAFGISLIVTTYQSGKVILVRAPERTTLNTHIRGLPTPMGAAVGKGGLAIGTRREIVDYRNQPWVAKRLDPSDVNDAVMVPQNVHVTGDIRIHEMVFAGGDLWVINTMFSALCTIDHWHSFVPRWRPPFVTELAAEDRCHLNGVAADGDRIRYVSAFGETDTAGGWRANKAFGGVIVDVASGATVVRGLSMPHSPRLYSDCFWILESGRGTLAKANLSSGAVETIAELPGFTRGLAFAGPFAFVGLSQVRESNVFGGIPLVDRVKERQCGIWVIDLRSRQIAGVLRFEGIVHEIFDVQILHGARYPELLEISDDRLGGIYVLPESHR